MSDIVTVALIGAAAGVVTAIPSLLASLATLRQSRKNNKQINDVHSGIDGKMRDMIRTQMELALQLGLDAGKKLATDKRRRVTDKKKE